MRTLWENFYADRSDLGLDVSGVVRRLGAYHGAKVDRMLPYGQLWRTHAPTPPENLANAVYLVRDGRDVALSVARFRQPTAAGCRAAGMIPTMGWYRKLFQTWRDHVDAYGTRDVPIVRYEQLVVDAATVIARIARQFGLRVRAVPVTIDHAVGWQPSDDLRIGKWRDQMPPEVLRLFDQIVPRGHSGRYDRNHATTHAA
jgi:hypothetical protein